MGAWNIDPGKRREGFARLRREEVVAQAAMSAAARIELAEEMLRIARAVRPEGEPVRPAGRPRRGPRR